jgi:hypothetical protein
MKRRSFGAHDERPEDLPLFIYRGEPPFQAHSETSEAAAVEIDPLRGAMRRRVFEFIAGRGAFGSTDDEVESELGMRGSTVRPRRCELVSLGLVELAGFTRPTRSGRLAEVYRVPWVLLPPSSPGGRP